MSKKINLPLSKFPKEIKIFVNNVFNLFLRVKFFILFQHFLFYNDLIYLIMLCFDTVENLFESFKKYLQLVRKKNKKKEDKKKIIIIEK